MFGVLGNFLYLCKVIQRYFRDALRQLELTLIINNLKVQKRHENEQDVEDYSSDSRLHCQHAPWSGWWSDLDVRLTADG